MGEESKPEELRDRENALLKRLGKKALSEMLATQTEPTIELHPEELQIMNWLRIDQVKGKFDSWWHKRVADAVIWAIPVPFELSILADVFDRLFPNTLNVFNLASHRPPVTEPLLLDYLSRVHNLDEHSAANLTLIDLVDILQSDLPKSESATQTIHNPNTDKPTWNKERRELTFRGQLCKKFRQRAQNQIPIIEAFDTEGWPAAIDDPLHPSKKGDNRQRLTDAIWQLNRQNLILFELDGRGRILWKPN